MDKKLLFGENAKNYDLWRPKYCDELFDTIFNYCSLSPRARIIEVGCGTGQATLPFITKGHQVHAIELSKEMSNYVGEKFARYDNFSVSNAPFEESNIEDNTIDLLYSATAFHWVDENKGYMKVRKILKKDGVIALFWNHPSVAKSDDVLHQDIQRLYREYSDKGYREKREAKAGDDNERYKRICLTLRRYGFVDVKFQLFRKTRKFLPEDYICLLNTYSDHRMMNKHIKKIFERELVEIIHEHGGILNVYDTIDLYLAKNNRSI